MEVVRGVGEVVHEQGVRESVAEGVLKRGLPVGETEHARHGAAAAGQAVHLDQRRDLADGLAGDEVGKRLHPRDGPTVLVQPGVFAEDGGADLARPGFAVLPFHALRVRLAAVGRAAVGHAEERPGHRRHGRRGPVRVIPHVGRGRLLRSDARLPEGQRHFPQLGHADVYARQPQQRVRALAERAAQRPAAFLRLPRRRRGLALDPECRAQGRFGT